MPLDASALTAIAMNVIASLEAVTGVPMVIIDRASGDPLQVWKNAQAQFCQKSGGAICDLKQVQYLVDTQNFAGFSTVIVGSNGKRICGIMPPDPRFNNVHAAMAISGGKVFNYRDLPSKGEVDAFLLMHNAAQCLTDKANSVSSGARADAFAALTLALIQGDPGFTRVPNATPARKFAFMRNGNTTSAAINVGERLMLDTWKAEAVAALKQQGCQAGLQANPSTNVPAIQRDSKLPLCTTYEETGMTGYNANASYATGMRGTQRIEVKHPVPVTDGNLHLWMYGEQNRILSEMEVANPVLGAPPQPWRPFKPFATTRDAVSYTWGVARQVTGM